MVERQDAPAHPVTEIRAAIDCPQGELAGVVVESARNDGELQSVDQEKVQRLEDELLKMEQADIVTEHTFLPGIYERKITIPPWCAITGAAHKTDYSVRLERGTISVNTEAGVRTFTGPMEFQAKAGIKRAGFVYADEVVWVDVYKNEDDCRNISELEDRLYVVPAIGLGETRKQLALAQREPERIGG